MRVLVAWDDAGENDLLNLYLSTTNEVTSVSSADAMLHAAQGSPWDVILLTVAFCATPAETFALFEQLRQLVPGVPVVVGCRPVEMIHLPRFLKHGLRFYVLRDPQGDFIFLLLNTLEAAVEAIQADEARKLAEKLREEMDSVRRLQESIIPQGLTPPKGYRVAARYEPAQLTTTAGQPVVMAGGDYYDLFLPDEGTLILLVGDASGHGLKACMSIMAMHTLVRMFGGDRYRDTAGFVAEINQRLCENSIVQSGGGFITLLYAAIDTRAHTMTWTTAGHPCALLHQLDSDTVTQIGANSDGGLPLGIAPGMPYDAFTHTLPPRSRLLLYSDGLTDALSDQQDSRSAFGVRGITEALQSCRERTLDETLEYLFHASSAYTGGHGRHDDTSVLLLERGEM